MTGRRLDEVNLALGCGFAVALLVALGLIVYLWTV